MSACRSSFRIGGRPPQSTECSSRNEGVLMRELLNTLYVQTPGTWLLLDHDTVLARIGDEPPRRVPLRRLEGIVVFGPVNISAPLIHRCGKDGIHISWLTSFGRFGGALRGPTSGNVLLRQAQYLHYGDSALRLAAARTIVAGKILNCVRFARHGARLVQGGNADLLRASANVLDEARTALIDARDLDTVRGIEGAASKRHFDDLRLSLQTDLGFASRTRRPPLSPFNALLSFLYGLVRHRTEHALDATGLDPQVGFLHSVRPGRPALALDLMEEHRPIVDRFAVTMANRRQIDASSFDIQEGGSVLLNEDGRKIVLVAWSAMLENEVTHRVLKEQVPYGLVFQLQATILARYIRGDLPGYLPFIIKGD
jgi:CRISPR-associated protein Cas1